MNIISYHNFNFVKPGEIIELKNKYVKVLEVNKYLRDIKIMRLYSQKSYYINHLYGFKKFDLDKVIENDYDYLSELLLVYPFLEIVDKEVLALSIDEYYNNLAYRFLWSQESPDELWETVRLKKFNLFFCCTLLSGLDYAKILKFVNAQTNFIDFKFFEVKERMEQIIEHS